jgi:hypothetical protein
MNFAQLLEHLMLGYGVTFRLLWFHSKIEKQTIKSYLTGKTHPKGHYLHAIASAFFHFSGRSNNAHEFKMIKFMLQTAIKLDKLEAKKITD